MQQYFPHCLPPPPPPRSGSTKMHEREVDHSIRPSSSAPFAKHGRKTRGVDPTPVSFLRTCCPVGDIYAGVRPTPSFPKSTKPKMKNQCNTLRDGRRRVGRTGGTSCVDHRQMTRRQSKPRPSRGRVPPGQGCPWQGLPHALSGCTRATLDYTTKSLMPGGARRHGAMLCRPRIRQPQQVCQPIYSDLWPCTGPCRASVE